MELPWGNQSSWGISQIEYDKMQLTHHDGALDFYRRGRSRERMKCQLQAFHSSRFENQTKKLKMLKFSKIKITVLKNLNKKIKCAELLIILNNFHFL